MPENLLAFLIWAAVGCLFLILGVHAFFAKKPQHFWANVKMGKVREVKKYNRAVGKLFFFYGVVEILLGLPLLGGNQGLIVLTALGMVFVTILIMGIYAAVIEPKYIRK